MRETLKEELSERRDVKKRRTLVILSILFLLVFPAVLVIFSALWLRQTWIRPEVTEEVTERLSPSQILNDKIKYEDQFLVLRGQVVTETAVCERKVCPEHDPCCGCENERDLIIADSGTSIVAQSPGRLRLLTSKKKPFCYRDENSCEYNCSGWRSGEIYEVKGIFRATPPPRGTGWKLYFDYYFEVQEKELVGTVGIIERVKALFNDIKKVVTGAKTGGYYILR